MGLGMINRLQVRAKELLVEFDFREFQLASTELQQPFHRAPTDPMIVATARVQGFPLLTENSEISTCSTRVNWISGSVRMATSSL
jgi:PIN domain nuclease of toxin-antitoxin system